MSSVVCIGGGGIRSSFTAAALGHQYKESNPLVKRADEYSGVSAGSIIAAVLATGQDPGDAAQLLIHRPVVKQHSTAWKAYHALRCATGHANSLYTGNTLKGFLHESFGEKPLIAPLSVACSCATTLQQRLFSTKAGSRVPVDTVVASCSIPGVFPAVQIDKGMYIDGGGESQFARQTIREFSNRSKHDIMSLYSANPWMGRTVDEYSNLAYSLKNIGNHLVSNYKHYGLAVDHQETLEMLDFNKRTVPDGSFAAWYTRGQGGLQLADMATPGSAHVPRQKYDATAVFYAPTPRQYINAEKYTLVSKMKDRNPTVKAMLDAGEQGGRELQKLCRECGIIPQATLKF